MLDQLLEYTERVLIAQLPPWFWLCSAAAFGLALGSFLNVVIYRLPRGMSLSQPASTCPQCGERIRISDNIPVFSYALLRGRARCCGTKINPRYPLIELLGGLVGAALVKTRILPLGSLTISEGIVLFVLYLTLCLGLIAASAIDLEQMILPDSITIGGAVVGFGSAWIRHEVDLLTSLIGAVGGLVLIWFPFIWAHEKLRGFPGMGLGDAKLVALAGAWFGGWGALFVLFAAAIQGTFATLSLALLGQRIEDPQAVIEERKALQEQLETAEGEEREQLLQMMEEDPVMREADGTFMGSRIPFGPFLALATIELTVFYEPITRLAQRWLLL